MFCIFFQVSVVSSAVKCFTVSCVSNVTINAAVVFDLIVIGGGAAGFYGAIQAGELKTGLRILILEKSRKLLSKVRVSGGGRCNVTHDCSEPSQLSRHYPRGDKQLRTIFKQYHTVQTREWFLSKGVKLKVEEDGRVFPVTDDSQTIIDCFFAEAQRLNIKIEAGVEVTEITRQDGQFAIWSSSAETFYARRILVAAGGSPKLEAYSFIARLGHTIKPPIPSLFTFNAQEKKFNDLMGVAVADTLVRIVGTKFQQRGPVLITHWGLSGPAVIRLSAWAAGYLHSVGYHFQVLVSWLGSAKEEDVRKFLIAQKDSRMKQKIHNNPLFGIPQRLWWRLSVLAGIPEDKIWGEVSHRNLNKLLEFLLRCPFNISGKTTFKEEFVTCGGVDLGEVDLPTMESKIVKGLYFAGEVVNVDGETGGFNFQAAWSMAFVAAKSVCLDQSRG